MTPKICVSAAQMWDDGTFGAYKEVVVDKVSDFAVNHFLQQFVDKIGDTMPDDFDEPVTCDAIDVTISLVRS